MSKNIISNNLTTEQLYLNSELNYIFYPDLSPEERFFQWEQEVEAAINCAQEFLKVSSQDISEAISAVHDQDLVKEVITPNLAHECAAYLNKQYETTEKRYLYNDPEALATLRINWDQNLLDFIRRTIWNHLKKHVALNDAAFPLDSYNKTSNAIFFVITPYIYLFASKIIQNIPSYLVGY